MWTEFHSIVTSYWYEKSLNGTLLFIDYESMTSLSMPQPWTYALPQRETTRKTAMDDRNQWNQNVSNKSIDTKYQFLSKKTIGNTYVDTFCKILAITSSILKMYRW